MFEYGWAGKSHVPCNGRNRLLLYRMASSYFVNDVHKSLQIFPAKTPDVDTPEWKLLDAASAPNLVSIARCLTGYFSHCVEPCRQLLTP